MVIDARLPYGMRKPAEVDILDGLELNSILLSVGEKLCSLLHGVTMGAAAVSTRLNDGQA